MQAEKLSITLPANMARMIRREVESGAYASTSEVIRDAVRLWQDRKEERARRLDAIRAKIDQAAENPERIPDDEIGRHFDERLAKAETKQAP